MRRGFIGRIRRAAAKRILFLPHAVRQMAKPDRMIAPREVESTVADGEVIEEYTDDVRGHGERGRPIHVVCAPKRGTSP